ncbi:MAG: SIR2 family protein [Rhodobacteraceae bacterium]|nr:SIR2 family protein [Paracoccaceae bacterium]
MQFTKNGPEIPERLLQEHEEGKVVFFCGAGISYAAGLPGFKDLVKRLNSNLRVTPDAAQKAARQAKRYDHAITRLDENPHIGRKVVRQEILQILQPDLSRETATRVHEALLDLGCDRKRRTRLVTTNFDRIFEHVIQTQQPSVKHHQAPLLPVPKTRWDGLVYLHGLLPDPPHDNDLEDLVVSSGDFGLAYLTERWAARFVSELLQRFTVCFVGYSLDDPVMRYMMDALAADRLRGESPREMFAFGSYSKGKESDCAAEWRAKNVTPILYRAYRKHYYLRETLRQWANTYRDGLRGKRGIVVRHSTMNPDQMDRGDAGVRRMLWALSDPSGDPARTFARMDPVPSLAWLGPFSDLCFGDTDLDRFGVTPKTDHDHALKFSLLRRPAPSDRAPWMALVNWEASAGPLDAVMEALGEWLIRHLNNPDLLFWLIGQGGHLHPEFARKIRNRLEELATMESEGSSDQLTENTAGAPDAVPCPAMRTLWSLFLSGRVKRRGNGRLELYTWKEEFDRDGLTPTLRMELRELLRPCVVLRKPFDWSGRGDRDPEGSPTIRNLADTSLDLATDSARHILKDRNDNEAWMKVLPSLLEDITGLLRDAMDLKSMLGDANDQQDRSYIVQPSISDHPQNSDVHDWTVLIDLAREAWLAAARHSPAQACHVATGWSQIPYPLFRRLAFFAAAQGDIIPVHQGLQWLLADKGWWLWSPETHRESLRLVVALAPLLDDFGQVTLQSAILTGPPRDMYKPDLSDEHWTQIVDRDVWLRLRKIQHTGALLTADPQRHLEKLTAQYPDWKLSDNEREEFLVWSVGPEDIHRDHIAIPRDLHGLVQWLRKYPEPDFRRLDDWEDCCRHDFETAAQPLIALAKNDFWPAGRWQQAFYEWSRNEPASRTGPDEEILPIQSWQKVAPILTSLPPAALQKMDRGMSFWLETLARMIDQDQAPAHLALCDRILRLDYEDTGNDADPLSRAINHPVGCIAMAVLHWWYRSDPSDHAELTGETRERFTALCDPEIRKVRHGRVVLARHVVALFRVDRKWTEQHLLPLFDWDRSETEAAGMWQGFLHSPQLHPPLMAAFKSDFLATADHFEQLGQCERQYATFLTFVALDSMDSDDIFSRSDFARAMAALPPDGLASAADALFRAVDSAGDQRAKYWANRATPFLRSIWPQRTNVDSVEVEERVAESLAKACLAAGDAFPDALEQVSGRLRPLRWASDRIAREILNTDPDLIQDYPEKVLDLLDHIVGEQSYVSNELSQCLESIESKYPDLAGDQRFERLQSIAPTA